MGVLKRNIFKRNFVKYGTILNSLEVYFRRLLEFKITGIDNSSKTLKIFDLESNIKNKQNLCPVILI